MLLGGADGGAHVARFCEGYKNSVIAASSGKERRRVPRIGAYVVGFLGPRCEVLYVFLLRFCSFMNFFPEECKMPEKSLPALRIYYSMGF